MAKVFLLDLQKDRWKTSFYYGENRLDPIYLGYLGAYLQNQGHEVEIFQQRGESTDEVVSRVCGFSPDLVGFSAFTFNFNASKNFARELKKLNPKIKTVFGGYHPSALPMDCLEEEGIDFVAVGEGEETLVALAASFNSEKKKDFQNILSLGFKEDGKPILNPRRPRIKDLDSLPFPLRYGLEDCKMGNPMLPIPQEQKSFAQITYSRGCYHQCTFCASPLIWQRQVFHRSPKNLVDEIEFLQNRYGTNALFFTDLTFNADERKAEELCDEIQRRKIKINWSAACRVTDNLTLLRKMRESGCIRIALGVESLDDNVTQSLDKGINAQDVYDCFEAANQLGMIARAYLMIGYPGENEESIRRTKQRLKNLAADNLGIAILTPYPGTPLYEQMLSDGMIENADLDDYDAEHPIIKTCLTPQRLIEARDEILSEYYSSPEYKKRIQDKTRKFPELKPAYESFNRDVEKSLSAR